MILAGSADSRNGLKALQMAPARASAHGMVEHVAGASHASILSGVHAAAVVRGVEHVRAAAHA